MLFITVLKFLESRSIQEVQDILTQLQDEEKKRKEKKKQKQEKWLQIRQEVSNLVKDVNFDQEMEEDERNEEMEIDSSDQETMDTSQQEIEHCLESSPEEIPPMVKFSTLLLMMYLKQKETKSTPIIQPFSCEEEKSPVQVRPILIFKTVSQNNCKNYI